MNEITESDTRPSLDEALSNAETVRLEILRKFPPVLAQLNMLLYEANEQGIDVHIDVGQCEGFMSVHVNVLGVQTPAGQLLAQRRGLIPLADGRYLLPRDRSSPEV